MRSESTNLHQSSCSVSDKRGGALLRVRVYRRPKVPWIYIVGQSDSRETSKALRHGSYTMPASIL